MNPETRTMTAHPGPAPGEFALAVSAGFFPRPGIGETETMEAIRAIAKQNGRGVQR